MNAEVNSGNRNAELASNECFKKLTIRGRHAGMRCDLKGIKHCSQLCLVGSGLEISINSKVYKV